jgi:hypothetical protein
LSADEFRPLTAEQREADRRRTEAELAEAKRRDAEGRLSRTSQPLRIGGDLNAALEAAKARADEAAADRRRLACFPGLEEGDEEAAVIACEDASAFVGCKWGTTYDACPRLRAPDRYDDVVRRLTKGNVADDETSVILAAARRRDRVPLRTLDALQVVRTVLARRRARVPLENGAEVRGGGARAPGEVHLTGTERLVVLAGNQGRGKTLAACYAIGRQGGMYTRAPQWTRRDGVSVEDAVRAPLLVIDQFGREHFGESDWMRSQFEDTVDARYQARRLTFLVGNLLWEPFVERLKNMTVVDRVLGEGVFVEFGGPSLRPDLRAEQLKLGGLT